MMLLVNFPDSIVVIRGHIEFSRCGYRLGLAETVWGSPTLTTTNCRSLAVISGQHGRVWRCCAPNCFQYYYWFSRI